MKFLMLFKVKLLGSDNVVFGKLNLIKKYDDDFCIFPQELKNVVIGRRRYMVGAGEPIEFTLLHMKILMTIPVRKY